MAAKQSATTLFLRLIALVVYILLGSLLFSYIELKRRRQSNEELSLKIFRGISFLLQNHSCSVNMSETQVQAFTQQFVEQVMEGSQEGWRFKDGLKFSVELLTTIGYGTTPPTTQAGRLLSVFYALVGIPLFMLVLKGLGELINKNITKAIIIFEKMFLRREQPRNIKGKVLYVYAVGMVVFILLVAVKLHMFPTYGTPTYIDAFYVVFITFSTVGFGDLTFGGSSENVPVTLLGLTLVSTTINAISVWFENREQETNRCMRCCKGNRRTNRTEIINDSGVEETELKTKISTGTSTDPHTTVLEIDTSDSVWT